MKSELTFNSLYNLISERKVPFFLVFFTVVTLTYAFLFVIDFIPEPVSETDAKKSVETEARIRSVVIGEEREEAKSVVESPLPTKIIFDSLNKEIDVLNPQSREIADLDEALLSGAVRHPDSADFTEDGNIFVLAHSSYLPNVLNKNFQAFNGIQELTWGDTVRLQSADTEYVYRVEKVYKAKATDVFVPETPGEARLTLATCNSFGSKDDRFMVETKLIGSHAL